MEPSPLLANNGTPCPVVGGVPCIYCSKWHSSSYGEQAHKIDGHPHHGMWVPISVCYSRSIIKDSHFLHCTDCEDWYQLATIVVCPICDRPMVENSNCPHCRGVGDVV